MEQIELVIRLPEESFNHYLECSEDSRDEAEIGFAVRHGTLLPKGHGRLIDADDVNNHIVGYVDLRGCKTIIEADKEGAEE